MDLIHNFFSNVYNVPELIQLVGFYGLILIVFAETGLLVGFFLPGDSLLITAGLFAARGDLDFTMLIVTLIPAAIVGNATGYYIGHRTGKALYSRPDSLLFRRSSFRSCGRSRPSSPASARWATGTSPPTTSSARFSGSAA